MKVDFDETGFFDESGFDELVFYLRWPRDGLAKKNWISVRTKKNTPEEKNKFVTFVLNRMKLSTEQRKTNNKDKKKRIKEKHQKFVTQRYFSSHT